MKLSLNLSCCIKLLISIIIMSYLLFQARHDARTGLTYTLLNNSVLVLTILLLFVKIIFQFPSIFFLIECIFVAFLLFLSTRDFGKKERFMQPADAKAYGSIYLSSVFIYGYDLALYTVGISIIIANLTAIFWYRVIKRCKQQERKPYFPFITIGYMFFLIIYILRHI